jgi:N-carbamoyl-L-amino-acid hydrolase
VVAWTNEEGSRFSPGAMGSSVFAGVRDLAAVRDIRDRSGVPLGDALAATLEGTDAPSRPAAEVKLHGYLEAHIEQGPLLEDAGLSVGVVTGIQGIRRLTVEVTGEEAHAGTVPRRARKDALSAAVAIVSALERALSDAEDVLRFTVGRFEVFPGSPNTVPGRVLFSIDLRHPDDAVLRAARDQIHAAANSATGPCSVTVTDVSHVEPTLFPETVVGLLTRSAAALGYQAMRLASGAGHDAMHLARVCPSGMLFIPCLRGISHNEAESITPADALAGTRVLADAVLALAQE